MELRNKTIFVLSPQSWDSLWISKHHYAIELAELKNEVYFFNPPTHDRKFKVKTEKHKDIKHLNLVEFSFPFPHILRHKARFFYLLLVRRLMSTLIKRIGKQIDLIWDFDINNVFFKGKLNRTVDAWRIFHPVDFNRLHNYRGAEPDILISVSNEIIDHYAYLKVPKKNLGHSVSPYFDIEVKQKPELKDGIDLGFAANFNKAFIDWVSIYQMSKRFKQLNIHLFGPNDDMKIASFLSSAEEKEFLNSPNVIFEGSIPKKDLPNRLAEMDGLFMFYDYEKNYNKNSNSHKILEYMLTSKPILSDYLSFYSDKTHLIYMAQGADVEDKLKATKEFMDQLNELNAPDLIKERKNYASQFTYKSQIERVVKMLEKK